MSLHTPNSQVTSTPPLMPSQVQGLVLPDEVPAEQSPKLVPLPIPHLPFTIGWVSVQGSSLPPLMPRQIHEVPDTESGFPSAQSFRMVVSPQAPSTTGGVVTPQSSSVPPQIPRQTQDWLEANS